MTHQWTVESLICVIEKQAPLDLAEPWDACGLVCGSRTAPVRRVMASIECTADLVQEALDEDVDLLCVHHPPLLGGVQSLLDEDPERQAILMAIRRGLAVYTAHTNADSARWGLSDLLAELLGGKPGGPLIPGVQEGTGLGRMCRFSPAISSAQLVQRLQQVCGRTHLNCAGVLPSSIEHCALLTGSGAGMLDAARDAGAQVYITGDLKYHDAVRAVQLGICVVDATHFGTEQLFDIWVQRVLAQAAPEVQVLKGRSVRDPLSVLS